MKSTSICGSMGSLLENFQKKNLPTDESSSNAMEIQNFTKKSSSLIKKKKKTLSRSQSILMPPPTKIDASSIRPDLEQFNTRDNIARRLIYKSIRDERQWGTVYAWNFTKSHFT